MVLSGNLFDFAIIKTSVISEEFRERYLSNDGVFEGRAVVFDGSDDYHHRINDPELGIDERTILVIRGAGPVGWPALPKWSTCSPRRAHQARHQHAANHRRRPAVGHLGQPLDPQRRARERRGRRPGLVAHR